MRMQLLTTTAALLAATAALGACGARTDNDENRRYPRDTTYRVDNQTSIAAHRDFEEGVRRRLDDLDRKVAELRSRANTAASDEAKRLNSLADDIAEMKDKAVNKLNDLRDAANDKWDDMRTKVEKSLVDAEDKARDAFNTPR